MNSHRICWFVCFSLMLAIFVIGASGPMTKAEVVEKSWISGTIEATKKKDLSADEFATRAYSYSYRDCVNVKGQEWVSTPWWVWTPPKELVTNEQCVAQTANGYFGQDNTSKFVIPYGSSNIQRVYGYDGYDYRNSYMYPVPNTNRILYLTALGFYAPSAKLNVINDWNETYPASTTLSALGNVQRNQVKDFDYTLSDENGAVQGVSLNGLTSSANGEWAAVLASNRSYLLLNMTTHETISFDIDDHSNYSVHMAASNDGKFAAKASWQNTLKLYDTTKCQPSQPSLASRSCEAKELLGNQGDDTVLRRLFPGKEIIIGRLLFVGNGDALDVDMHVMDGTSDQYFTYRLKPSGLEPVKYLALGDSFSSGEGAYTYRSPTDFYIDDNNYNLCHQSKNSYPYLMQQSQQFEWFNSVACSGARMKDIEFYDAISDYYDQKPQALSGILSEEKAAQYKRIFSPGYVSQSEFVREYSPSVATISIGGNDIGFGDIISTCIINTSLADGLNQLCFYDRKDRELLANQIDQKISKLAANFRTIKNSMSGENPRLYVVGYPQIIRPDGFCNLNVPLLQSEIYAAITLTDYINAAIKVAADAAGVRFVNMTNALVDDKGDYRLCSDKSELAVNGLVMGGDSSKKPTQWMYDSESFHPNQLGQSMMAETLRQQTADLSLEMPDVKDGTSTLRDKRINFVGDDDILYQNYRITYQKDIAPALIVKGEKVQIDIPKSPDDLPAKADTSATATAHSTPIDLGQLPISPNGTISGEITIPTTIETGYHRLIISYTDIADNTVEKYAYFYAAHSSDDWDGDGVGNTSDPCVSVPQSGVDQDEDGIDDACDGEYIKDTKVAAASPNADNNSQSYHTATNNPFHMNDNKETLSFDQPSELTNIFQNPAVILPIPSTQRSEVTSKSNNSDAQTNNDSSKSMWMLYVAGIIVGLLILVRLMKSVRVKS